MSSLTNRVTEIAAQFEAANDEVVETLAHITDEQWRQPCENDERTVGVVAHHIAVTQQGFSRIIEALVSGDTYTPNVSMDEVHQMNAQHARENADVGKPETLDILKTSRAAFAPLLRRLDDEQLDRTAGVFGGNELSVAQVMEYVVIGHAREHLTNIRATIVG